MTTVFSTYVEVILTVETDDGVEESILHVCGGDPIKLGFREAMRVYSPRMWR